MSSWLITEWLSETTVWMTDLLNDWFQSQVDVIEGSGDDDDKPIDDYIREDKIIRIAEPTMANPG